MCQNATFNVLNYKWLFNKNLKPETSISPPLSQEPLLNHYLPIRHLWKLPRDRRGWLGICTRHHNYQQLIYEWINIHRPFFSCRYFTASNMFHHSMQLSSVTYRVLLGTWVQCEYVQVWQVWEFWISDSFVNEIKHLKCFSSMNYFLTPLQEWVL